MHPRIRRGHCAPRSIPAHFASPEIRRWSNPGDRDRPALLDQPARRTILLLRRRSLSPRIELYQALRSADANGLRAVLSRPEHTIFPFVVAAVTAVQPPFAQLTPYGDWGKPEHIMFTLWIGALVLSLFRHGTCGSLPARRGDRRLPGGIVLGFAFRGGEQRLVLSGAAPGLRRGGGTLFQNTDNAERDSSPRAFSAAKRLGGQAAPPQGAERC